MVRYVITLNIDDVESGRSLEVDNAETFIHEITNDFWELIASVAIRKVFQSAKKKAE